MGDDVISDAVETLVNVSTLRRDVVSAEILVKEGFESVSVCLMPCLEINPSGYVRAVADLPVCADAIEPG